MFLDQIAQRALVHNREQHVRHQLVRVVQHRLGKPVQHVRLAVHALQYARCPQSPSERPDSMAESSRFERAIVDAALDSGPWTATPLGGSPDIVPTLPSDTFVSRIAIFR